MTWNLTWEEFVSCVNSFLGVSEDIGDGWKWHGDQSNPGSAFAVRKSTKTLPRAMNEPCEVGEDLCLEMQAEVTDASIVPLEKDDLTHTDVTWEYHILFSHSYGSPVLYFNAWTPDGRLLPLERVWEGLSTEDGNALKHLRWEALSQQEHPILRRPFFQLHPCKTAELLGFHQGHSKNPLVTWLSSVGPAVGIQLNSKYSILV